jgi:hypothetical protein
MSSLARRRSIAGASSARSLSSGRRQEQHEYDRSKKLTATVSSRCAFSSGCGSSDHAKTVLIVAALTWPCATAWVIELAALSGSRLPIAGLEGRKKGSAKMLYPLMAPAGCSGQVVLRPCGLATGETWRRERRQDIERIRLTSADLWAI